MRNCHVYSVRLEKAQEENRNVAVEKQNLERKMMDEIQLQGKRSLSTERAERGS